MNIFQMSLSASVLILAVLIIRAFTLHKLPKKTFLLLWGVVLCRLLIPFAVSSRFSVYTGIAMIKHMIAYKPASLFSAGLTSTHDIVQMPRIGEAIGVSASAAAISPLEMVWLVGICASALFFIVVYIKVHNKFKISLPVENSFVVTWLQEHPLRRPVRIRQSDCIVAPLTYGINRPVVLMPKTTDWTDETTLRYILTHEYAHIRHFDTLFKLILTAAVCVHWFNPLVWLMFILANRDIELSCDETVVRTCGEATKLAYALTLIGFEEKKACLSPLVSNFSKYAIEERIVSIMKTKRLSLVGVFMVLTLVIGTTTVFATNAAKAPYSLSVNANNNSSNSIAPLATATIPEDNKSFANINSNLQSFEKDTAELSNTEATPATAISSDIGWYNANETTGACIKDSDGNVIKELRSYQEIYGEDPPEPNYPPFLLEFLKKAVCHGVVLVETDSWPGIKPSAGQTYVCYSYSAFVNATEMPYANIEEYRVIINSNETTEFKAVPGTIYVCV